MPDSLSADAATALPDRAAPSGSWRLTRASIVLPTFNERENIGLAIAAIDAALHGIVAYEIVVVDDDSPDRTWEVAGEIAATRADVRVLRRQTRRGLSSAVVDGIAAAAGDALVVMDADLQHDERVLPAMLAKLREAPLVIGSRYADGGSTGKWGKRRRLLSRLGVRACQLLTGLTVRDPMSGFFAIRREAYDPVAPRLRPIGFKILVDLMSLLRGVAVAEVPYTFRARQHGESKLSYLVGVEFLLSLYEIRFGRLVPSRFLKYAFVGALGVGVNLSALTILDRLLPALPTVSIAAAIAVSIAFNYAANDAFTFAGARGRGGHVARFARYALACALGACVNGAATAVLHAHGWPMPAAGLVGIALATMWNYTLARTLVWSDA